MLRIIKASGAQDLPELLCRGIGESLDALRSGRSGAKRVILVVPAQFTLRAEELLFEKLGAEGFFDLHAVSNNRLAQQMIKETGGMGRTPVNTLGRSMLLRRILKEQGPELGVFSSVAGEAGFMDMVGDLIVQLKQNNVTAADIPGMISSSRGGLISGKLSDMQRIYEAYDRAMEGRFSDSEDLRAFVTSRVKDCSWVCDAEFWYYGFYSFTQRDADFIGELIRSSKGVNVVLLCGDPAARPELFAAPERTVRALSLRAEACGSACSIVSAEGYMLERPAELVHLEKQLFCLPPACAGAPADPDVLQIVKAVSPEAQAESIAIRLLELMRDRAYRAQDIAVVTNDMASQGNAIKRVFSRYGIPFFIDEKRSVQHNPAVAALCALLDIAADGYKTDAVLRFLKSGFSGIASAEETAAFENYIVQYHIKGERFFSPFKYGRKALGDDVFSGLEAVRARLASLLEPFMSVFLGAPSVREKTGALYGFLDGTLGLADVLEQLASELAESGLADASEEMSQIWDVIVGLLDQVCELLGDEALSAEEYRDLIEDSFGDIKLGLLPQEEGSVLLGTVGRTRLSGIKALFVAGVNDGILPKEQSADGIFTEREQEELERQGIVLSKSRDKMRQEELLSVYRSFCEPSEFLWLGYSMSDASGDTIKPSSLIDGILSMFPGLEAEPDLSVSGGALDLVQNPYSATAHMTDAFRDYLSGESETVSDIWKLSYNELSAAGYPHIKAMRSGLFYGNDPGRLGSRQRDGLYSRDGAAAILSASQLESFARCPFAYFVKHGLKPAERRSFEMGGSEIGTVYHECLLKLCERLSRRVQSSRLPVNDPSSDWMTVTEERISEMIAEILDELAVSDMDGLLSAGKAEKYRSVRIQRTCSRFAWQLVEQVRRGNIRSMLYEAAFGRGRALPALSVDTALGRVEIEGKIDRVDVLVSGDSEYVKIIDYKSGKRSFDRAASEKGLALQLNIYLESAVCAGLADRPAGMFYCNIDDSANAASVSELCAGSISENLAQTLKNRFRLNGIMVGEAPVVQAIDRGIDEGETSSVLGVSRNKNGEYRDSAVTKLVSAEEFDEFRSAVRDAVKRLCSGLLSGDIGIAPKRIPGGGNKTACDYCDYRSICLFEG